MPAAVNAVISPAVGRPLFHAATGHVSPLSTSVTVISCLAGFAICIVPSPAIVKSTPNAFDVWTRSPSSTNGCTGRPELNPKSPFTAAIAPRRLAMSLVFSRPARRSFDSAMPIDAPCDGSTVSTYVRIGNRRST